MSDNKEPGWYYADGDPEGSVRFWDGSQRQGPSRPASDAQQIDALYDIGSNRRMATIWERLVARYVDLWILGMSMFFVSPAADDLGVGRVAEVVFVFFYLFFAELILMKKKSANIGKLLIGLKVVSATGQQIDNATIAKRLSLYLLLYIPLAVSDLKLDVWFASWGFMFAIALTYAVVSIVMILKGEYKQAPHDKIAKTIVVRPNKVNELLES